MLHLPRGRAEIPKVPETSQGQCEEEGHTSRQDCTLSSKRCIAGKRILLTFDTGAMISLLPSELVGEDKFTGERSKFKEINCKREWPEVRVVTVTVTVGNDKYLSKAVALLGESIDWTAVLSIDEADEDLTTKMMKHIRGNKTLPHAETHYLPPWANDGRVIGAVLVSEGEVVKSCSRARDSL